jgi:hypothetical protein
MLGGYHNFMILPRFDFQKIIYKKVQFFPKKHFKFFCVGQGYQHFKKKLNRFSQCCDTKKSGSEITQYTDCLHDPKHPCFPDLLHTVQTYAHPQHTNCLLTLPDAHYKIRDVQVFCFYTTTWQISHHPSPTSPIHTNASKGNFFITNYIHSPKAQA